MVLSNKKLKQKLRAAKAELLAASEAQIYASNSNLKNPEDPNSNNQESLKSVVESVAQKPGSSKRGKRRKKVPSLEENDDKLNGSGGGDGKPEKAEVGLESVVKDNKKRGKRKKDEGKQELEDGKVKKLRKLKKKKKRKRKGGEKVDNGKVKEGLLSVDDGGIDGQGGQGVTETANTDISEGSFDFSTKVYVGGIPYYSTEDDIRSYFESCGTITEIDCMTFPESGKFRGIAIMNFKTEAAAKRALALDGSDMGGFFLKIQPYKPTRVGKTSKFSPTIVEGYNRIYVGNLSWDITEEDLRKFFSGCSIASVRFGEDKETGEFRGYAHVDFSNSLSRNLALKLDQKIVCGRPVRISCAVPKKGSDNKMRSMPENNEAVGEGATAVGDGATAVSGKIRRRTCYECGERGHLSSSCPKKQAVDQTNPPQVNLVTLLGV